MGIVTDVFLPLALAFIMFALGLGLTGNDFLRVAKQPRDFFVGAFSQIILLPIIAFILVKIWPIAPNKTSTKSIVETFFAIGSNDNAIPEANLLNNTPNITGTVTIKNIFRAMPISEIS